MHPLSHTCRFEFMSWAMEMSEWEYSPLEVRKLLEEDCRRCVVSISLAACPCCLRARGTVWAWVADAQQPWCGGQTCVGGSWSGSVLEPCSAADGCMGLRAARLPARHQLRTRACHPPTCTEHQVQGREAHLGA